MGRGNGANGGARGSLARGGVGGGAAVALLLVLVAKGRLDVERHPLLDLLCVRIGGGGGEYTWMNEQMTGWPVFGCVHATGVRLRGCICE